MDVRSASTNPVATLVGANIRTAREEAGLKQRELAAAIECETVRVSEWECGRHRPRDATLARIADELRRSIGWFFMDHSTKAAA